MKPIMLVVLVALVGCTMQTGPTIDSQSGQVGTSPGEGRTIPVVHLHALDDYLRSTMENQGKEVPAEFGQSPWTIPVGMVQTTPLPAVQSYWHQKELELSRRLYDEGRYAEAAQAVRKAVEDEPENEFLLECYARALYRMEDGRPASYGLYRRLISLLDAKDDGNATIPLDAWFVEAYWKYGTLLMDRREWQQAAFEISRALAILYSQNDVQEFVPQAYSYLAEAYFFMGRYEVSRYYAEAALQVDPENGYVRPFLER